MEYNTNLNSKGFAVSPFFIIALILLGVIIAIHFIHIDNTKAKSIAQEGKLNKAILDMEEPKATLQSLALFSAYQAAYDAGKMGISDERGLKDFLSEEIAEDLNKQNFGSFSVEVKSSEDNIREGFITSATGGKVTASGEIPISSDIAIEKFVGARIFLLRDLSEDLEGEFKRELAEILECTLSGVSDCSSNEKISCSATSEIKNDEHKVPEEFMKDASQVAEKIKESLLELETKVSKDAAFKSLKDEHVALKFKIEKITADIMNKTRYKDKCCERDEEGKCIEVDWDYNVDLRITGEIEIDAYLVDYATLTKISKEKFEICTEAPIILESGEIKPLEFNRHFTIEYEINLNYNSDCEPDPVTDPDEEIHPNVPIYSYNEESLKYDVDSNSIKCSWGSGYIKGRCAGIKIEEPCGCVGVGGDCAGEGESCIDIQCCEGLICDGGICKKDEDDEDCFNGERTNEYYEPGEHDCNPGTKIASCSSKNDCVDCGGRCKKSDDIYFGKKWLCLDGKWDKCKLGDDYIRGNWKCDNGRWKLISTVARTNEYYEPGEHDCNPGTKIASCSSKNDCVDCGGRCKKSDDIYFGKKWLCLDGKWDKCTSEDDGETRGNWECDNGKWKFVPCED